MRHTAILRWATLAVCFVLLAITPPTAAAAAQRYLNRVFAYSLTSNVIYGSADRGGGVSEPLYLDLYQPKGDVKKQRPMVVYLHGGLCTGDKANPQDTVVTTDLARRGFVAVSINPRANCDFTQAGDDMQAAVRWAKAKRYSLRIDPAQIIVVGPSSGGFAAMDATFQREDPGTSGHARYSSRVAAGVAIGASELDASKVDETDPPIALIHGVRDGTVPIAAAMATCEQTRAMGNVCELFVHPDSGHPPNFVINEHDLIVAEISGFICRNVIGCSNSPPPPDDPLP